MVPPPSAVPRPGAPAVPLRQWQHAQPDQGFSEDPSVIAQQRMSYHAGGLARYGGHGHCWWARMCGDLMAQHPSVSSSRRAGVEGQCAARPGVERWHGRLCAAAHAPVPSAPPLLMSTPKAPTTPPAHTTSLHSEQTQSMQRWTQSSTFTLQPPSPRRFHTHNPQDSTPHTPTATFAPQTDSKQAALDSEQHLRAGRHGEWAEAPMPGVRGGGGSAGGALGGARSGTWGVSLMPPGMEESDHPELAAVIRAQHKR